MKEERWLEERKDDSDYYSAIDGQESKIQSITQSIGAGEGICVFLPPKLRDPLRKSPCRPFPFK